MKKSSVFLLLSGFVMLTMLVVGALASNREPKPEVSGVRIGESREAVHRRLEKIGQLEKQERKQQEVWLLKRDRHYSHLIIGYNKTYTEVRYVTAKAREGGRPVRYSDVLDLKSARRSGSTNNNKYTLQVAARGNQPAYVLTARGADDKYLTYFSVEKID